MLARNYNLYVTFKVIKKILLWQATISRTWMSKDNCKYFSPFMGLYVRKIFQ